jgi:hypothetical protein
LKESFEFIVNGSVIESDFAEASALFPSVRERFSVDGCARKFILKANVIETADIRSFPLLLSDESISNVRSQVLLICLKSGIQKNVSDLLMEKLADLESEDVSILSLETLSSLLLSESVSIESEDSLLRHILKLSPSYWDLLRHIQVEFLSEDGLSLLEEYLSLPPESVWQCSVERLVHFPPLFDSRIISNFLEILAEFQGKQFSFLRRGSRNGFETQ